MRPAICDSRFVCSRSGATTKRARALATSALPARASAARSREGANLVGACEENVQLAVAAFAAGKVRQAVRAVPNSTTTTFSRRRPLRAGMRGPHGHTVRLRSVRFESDSRSGAWSPQRAYCAVPPAVGCTDTVSPRRFLRAFRACTPSRAAMRTSLSPCASLTPRKSAASALTSSFRRASSARSAPPVPPFQNRRPPLPSYGAACAASAFSRLSRAAMTPALYTGKLLPGAVTLVLERRPGTLCPELNPGIPRIGESPRGAL